MNTSPEDRIKLWKEFRKDLTGTDYEQLKKIAEFWGDMPFGSRCIDFYTPRTWPTPWEILHSGQFCRNTISLLIYYTLILNTTFSNRVSMHLIKDPDDIFVAPIVDDKHILNYILNEVQETTSSIKHQYINDEQIKKIN